MTKTTMSLSERLEKDDEGDFLRAAAGAVLQLIMETDVAGVIGAGRTERAEGRTTSRTGYRDRALDTRLGTLTRRVPKLRQGSCLPGFPDPRRISERALVAVAMGLEPWRHRGSLHQGRVGGVSTRRVDARVQAIGRPGISKSPVSTLCVRHGPLTDGGQRPTIDDRVGVVQDRPITGDRPCIGLDAT